MNPISSDPTAPPPPAQPPRSSFSCDRHPTEQFTGFCPSCLCERLTTLDQSSSNTPSSSRRPSSASAAAAAAIKSLFSKPNNTAPPPPPPKPSRPSSFFPELRRSKSFSASKNEALALGLTFEPQRKSCDVRARGTLSSLFTLDGGGNHKPSPIPASSIVASTSSHQNSKIANKPVFEETENEEDFKDPENLDDAVSCNDEDGDEIRPVRDAHLENLRNPVEIETISGEIVEEVEVAASAGNDNAVKPDDSNLETQEKKGGFWAAASGFSKKWHEWRRKQKLKKPTNGEDRFATLPVEKPISRQYRETQSEIADYGFGRRSCDTDPRFSLDAGRISFDDPRYSFDEPRASWDGYLVGRKSFSRMAGPPMVSVMEDTPNRPDMQIPVLEESLGNCVGEGEGEGESVVLPGGSIQTRDYYLDSSSRRRKSLDRCSSVRTSCAGEIDDLKSLASNARVSPTTADGFHGAKAMAGENNTYKINLRDSNSNSNSFRDDGSEAFELGSNGFIRDSSNSLIGNGDKKESKKSRRWSWRIWGFIHRRNNNNNNKDEDEVKYGGRANGVERSLSESWQNLRTESGDLRAPRLSRNMFRSNSSVSWRNSNGHHHVGGSFGSMRKSSVEVNGKRRKDEFVFERNRSARYSPNNIDNGLLKLYLAPMSNSRRGGGGLAKVKPNNSHSVGRSVLRLY